jgi:hypothetical protein
MQLSRVTRLFSMEGIVMKSHIFGFALLSVTAIVASVPAQAQNGSLTRSFVSSAGSDSNPCTITQPCASFAQAYTKVGADGIIAALDPGKYGPLSITGPVTVNGNGWAAITAPAQANGINISAGSGNVILTGLEIDGAGAAYEGIVFISGGSLTISNCIVKDFVQENGSGLTGNGILIIPETGNINFTIINTIAINNQFAGISYLPSSSSPTASGAIDHVVANNNNGDGIFVSLAFASGGSAAVNISNSVTSNNGGSGINTNGTLGTVTVTIENDEISNNTFGINNLSSTQMLGRSTITNNSNHSISNNGTIDTFQNNQFFANGNGNAISGNALTAVSTQ